MVVPWKLKIGTEGACDRAQGMYVLVCKRMRERDRDRDIRDRGRMDGWITVDDLFQNAEFGRFYQRINLTQLSLIRPLRP